MYLSGDSHVIPGVLGILETVWPGCPGEVWPEGSGEAREVWPGSQRGLERPGRSGQVARGVSQGGTQEGPRCPKECPREVPRRVPGVQGEHGQERSPEGTRYPATPVPVPVHPCTRTLYPTLPGYPHRTQPRCCCSRTTRHSTVRPLVPLAPEPDGIRY